MSADKPSRSYLDRVTAIIVKSLESVEFVAAIVIVGFVIVGFLVLEYLGARG
jgi:hypothetical protein